MSNVVVEHLNLDDIILDPPYQRGRKNKVQKMVRNWQPSAAGALLVSRRADGSNALVDGLQRTEAMKILKIPSWDCEIVRLGSIVEEARMFLQRNDRTNMSRLDNFRASLEAEEQDSLHIQRIVHDEGFRLQSVDSLTQQGPTIQAIAALEFAYRRGTLGWTLELIRNLWMGNSTARARALDGQFMKGLSRFLEVGTTQLGNAFDWDRTRKILGNLIPGQLLLEAHSRRATSHGDRPLVEVLIEHYNGRLGPMKRISY